jgi:hypothetical protein
MVGSTLPVEIGEHLTDSESEFQMTALDPFNYTTPISEGLTRWVSANKLPPNNLEAGDPTVAYPGGRGKPPSLMKAFLSDMLIVLAGS